MELFLTSSPCDDHVPGGVELPCIFFERNGFVKRLQACVEPGTKGLIIAAFPDAHAHNEEMRDTFAGCFAYHGMALSPLTLVDSRNGGDLRRLMEGCGMVILAGGHVPTQNAFFRSIGLRACLSDFGGVVMGISAGTMNCAETVYAQPEEPGEAVDPAYRRFIPGLGLTRFNVLPHYQQVRDNMLDGMRLFEDVTYGDSHGRSFYALPDGSYIHAHPGGAQLCGEGYLIRDGRIRQICREGACVPLTE